MFRPVSGRQDAMSKLEQDEVGSCSFIDVLEEAVLVKRPVAIELRDGTTFIDHVTDVTTESGQDFAVFRSHSRVPVREIAAATRAEPPRRSEPPDPRR
jgi:Rho-binding antiterminator